MDHTLRCPVAPDAVREAVPESPHRRRPVRPARSFALVLVLSGGLGGCVSTAPEVAPDAAELEAERTDTSPVERVEYDCAGLPVEAGLRTYSVELAYDDRTERLPRVVAGAGAKYETGVDEGYRLFWAKGETARLAIGSDAWRTCTQSSPAVPVANTSSTPAPPPSETPMPDDPDGTLGPPIAPAPPSARGNEPSWSLSVEPASGALTLRRADAAEPVVFPTISTTGTANGLRHVASTDAHEIAVEIERGLCHDDMSGMPYPASANVDIDGETLRGCAGSPVSLLLRTVLPSGEEVPAGGWIIERLADTPALDDPTATMLFTANGRVSGFTGCNRFDGRWKLSGEELGIDRVATTRMACRGPVALQESTLLTLLGDIRRFDVQNDGRLVLTGFDGSTLVARPEP